MPRKRKPITKRVPVAPATPLPVAPYVNRVEVAGGTPRVDITSSGLDLITMLAVSGAPQSKAAADLGISLSTFKRLMNDENDETVRLAWERGRADLEHEVAGLLLTSARKGNVIATIYYSKAALGWTESPAVANQVGVQIVLPDSLSSDDYAKRLAARTAITITDGGPSS